MNRMLDDYELETNAPKAMNRDEYAQLVAAEFKQLLDEEDPEKSYQEFLEQNPCLVPYQSDMGRNVVHRCLISQPYITDDEKVRKPDFMWITANSARTTPTLIEIERPDKKYARICDDVPRAGFSQARNQILEWKCLFDGIGSESFCDRFAIPRKYRRKKLSPYYVLVYGRRSEFESNEMLRGKRAQEQTPDSQLVSFDRLEPDFNLMQMPSATISNGVIELKYVPPTFKLDRSISPYLAEWHGFDEAVMRSPRISSERKEYLIQHAEILRQEYLSQEEGRV